MSGRFVGRAQLALTLTGIELKHIHFKPNFKPAQKTQAQTAVECRLHFLFVLLLFELCMLSILL